MNVLSGTRGFNAVRGLEVLKLRGGPTVSGCHFFEISSDGIAVYRRVKSPAIDFNGIDDTGERIAFGVNGLDELFGGGVP